MAFWTRNSNVTPIAIDFGVSSLKALQIEPGEPATMIAAACIDTPEELREDHNARLDFQCEQVGELLKSADFKGNRAICTIPAPFMFVQHIQAQRSDGVSLSDQVMAHLQSQLRCDPACTIVRQIEVAGTLGGGARSEIICFAVAQSVVMRIMNALSARRYEVVGAHSEHVALTHAFDHVTRRESDQTLTSLYLDLGAGSSKIVLTHGRDIVFAKTIRVSGVDFDAAIAEAHHCDHVQARARRLASCCPSLSVENQQETTSTISRVGKSTINTAIGSDASSMQPENASVAVETDRRHDATAPGLTDPIDRLASEDTERLLKAPIQSLVTEIGMCLRYHEQLFPDRSVDRAIFVGGEARHLALCQQIAKSLRLPAQIADPLTCMRKTGATTHKHIDYDAPQPGWATVFGLCFSPRNL
jgi:type IV pilus assembly protein PilM